MRARWPLPALLVALMAGACASTQVARSTTPAVDATIHERIAQAGGLPWNASHPLAWADFRGTPPDGGQEGAQTLYNLLFGAGCAGSTFRFDAAAVFLPRESWVKRAVLGDPHESARTLRHEQTHFDITEVFARRLRRFFATVYDPCGPGLDDTRTTAEHYVSGEADTQRRYDDETRHGLDALRQASWDQDVRGWLDELAGYRASHDAR